MPLLELMLHMKIKLHVLKYPSGKKCFISTLMILLEELMMMLLMKYVKTKKRPTGLFLIL